MPTGITYASLNVKKKLYKKVFISHCKFFIVNNQLILNTANLITLEFSTIIQNSSLVERLKIFFLIIYYFIIIILWRKFKKLTSCKFSKIIQNSRLVYRKKIVLRM